MLDGVHFGWSKIGRARRPRGAGRRRAHADARRAVSVRVSRPHRAIWRKLALRRRRTAVRAADRRGAADVLRRDARRHVRRAAGSSPTRRSAPSTSRRRRARSRARAARELRTTSCAREYVHARPERRSRSTSISAAPAAQGATPTFEATNLQDAKRRRARRSGRAARDARQLRCRLRARRGKRDHGRLQSALTLRNLDVAALEAYSATASDAVATGADPGHDGRVARAAPRARAEGRAELDARSAPLPLRRRAVRRPHRDHDEPGASAAGRHARPRQPAADASAS